MYDDRVDLIRSWPLFGLSVVLPTVKIYRPCWGLLVTPLWGVSDCCSALINQVHRILSTRWPYRASFFVFKFKIAGRLFVIIVSNRCLIAFCCGLQQDTVNRLTGIMQGFHLFTFKGIPVSVQPMFFLLLLILTFNMGDIGSMIVFAICACISLLCHEFGHALVARHYGLKPAITLNGFGGVTTRALSANPKQDFRITFMGPLTNLILAGIFFGISWATLMLGIGPAMERIPYLYTFLDLMC